MEKPKSKSNLTGDNLRDTSVNVASAFSQAVQDFAMSNGAVTTNGYPRTNGVAERGLGAPPPSRARKPVSRGSNRVLAVQEESDDDFEVNRLRGKSPLVEAASNFVRALSPGGSLYLRQRAGGAGDADPSGYQSLTGAFTGIKPQSSQGSSRLVPTQSQTSHGNVSSDYNYSREESMVNRMEPPPPGKPMSSASASAAAKKKLGPRHSSTIALDKQAYKPPIDEEEDDEDDWSEDEKGQRRKRSKHGPAQKKLDHLPTVGAQAKHRRVRKRKGKDGEEESESETVPRDSAVRSLRGSMPPPEPYDDQMEQSNEHFADEYTISDAQAHPSQSAFSIGGLLGKMVNMAFHLFGATVALSVNTLTSASILLLRIIASVFDICLIQPASFVMDRAQKIFGSIDWSSIGKGVLGLVIAWLFFNSLLGPNANTSTGRAWIPGWGQPSPLPSSIPTGDAPAALLEIARRLQDMENKVIDMQYAQRRAFDRLDSQARITDESASKLDSLGSAISKQNLARIESEEKLRSSSAAAITSLRTELSGLMNQLGHIDTSGADEKLQFFEKRLAVAEANVKDAVEVSKQALNTANTKAVSTGGTRSGGSIWELFGTGEGKSSLTIKSTDGRDVTNLISALVDNAVNMRSKDDIAKPDYASYFAGGRVIPQLTSQTFRIPAKSYWGSWGFGMFGQQTVEGRPPVTAIHPDIHVGNCWPFKGQQGQLGVVLARSIIVTDITIDHAPKEVAFDVRSAPKNMEVWGLVEGAENIKKVTEYHRRREQRYRDLVAAANREGRKPPPPEDPYPANLPPDGNYIRLAQFKYDVNAPSHIQTFSVPQDIQDLGVDVGIVVLMVRSNWGEKNWTCLYRFRVSGHDLDRRPYPLEEIDGE